MAINRTQIEHLERRKYFDDDDEDSTPWKDKSHSRKFYKKQMNKYMRKQKIEEDSYKRERRNYKGWEY